MDFFIIKTDSIYIQVKLQVFKSIIKMFSFFFFVHSSFMLFDVLLA